MLRTNLVRRAGRLLGAVTVTGVLSVGLLAATPAAAQTCVQFHVSVDSANGIKTVQRYEPGLHAFDANGI